VIRRFLQRQGRSVVSLLGARKSTKAAVGDVWATDRWNEELADELFRAGLPLVTVTGQRAALQLRGTFDAARTVPWLTESARVAAERINAHTLADLEGAVVDVDDPVAAARDTFDKAAGGRADNLGLGRATGLVNWARVEAGRQSSEADGRLRTKTWVVTPGKSRHGRWSGDTVPVGELFPNGADHPGDWILGVDDVAGCKCLMELR